MPKLPNINFHLSLSTLFYIYSQRGDLNTILGNYDNAEQDLLKAKDIALVLNQDSKKFNVFNDLAKLYFYQSKLDIVEKYLLDIQTIAIESKNEYMQATNKILWARCIYREKKLYDLALREFLSALSIYEKTNNKSGIAYCFREIGNIYFFTEKYNEAEIYSEKSLTIQREIGNILNIVYGLNDLSCVYIAMGKYSKAKELLLEAASLAEKTGDIWVLETIFFNLARVFKKTEDSSNFDYYYQKAIEIAKKINDKRFLKEKDEILK